GPDRDPREAALGFVADPQANAAARGPEPEIVHDEGRLLGSVNVEPRRRAGEDDPDAGPDTWLEVDVGLVDTGLLLPEPEPREVGVGDVLRGVIAAELVVGASVRGPEIEALEPPVRLDVERDAHEAARSLQRAGLRASRQLGFDR